MNYSEEFEELKCIGRGNFGAAFLVRVKDSPEGEEIYFIAKKIILGTLTTKEQEGAFLEVSITWLDSLTCFNKFYYYRLIYSKNLTIQILYLTSILSMKMVCSSLLWSSVNVVILHST